MIFNPFNLETAKSTSMDFLKIGTTGGVAMVGGNVLSNVLAGFAPQGRIGTFLAGKAGSALLKVLIAGFIFPITPFIKDGDRLLIAQTVLFTSAALDIFKAVSPAVLPAKANSMMFSDWAEFIGLPNTDPDNATLTNVMDYNQAAYEELPYDEQLQVASYMDDDEVMY